MEDSKSNMILISLATSPESSGHFEASEYVLMFVAIVLICSELESMLNRNEVYRSEKSTKVSSLLFTTDSTLALNK